MALIKEYINDLGITATYHRIADISQNFINPEPRIVVYVYSYADETFRETEKTLADKDVQKIVFANRYELPVDDTKGATRADMYARLKAEVALFEGAEDI